MTERIIYDLGANRGDNIAYYLQKADRVVAVEANPALAMELRSRFSAEIMSGRVTVENVVLTDEAGPVDFYVHRQNSVLSQMATPKPADAGLFDRMELPSRSASSIIAQYGEPLYVKIDVEGCDNAILKDMFNRDIRPPYISVEAHSIDVFASLCALGGYGAFKLVDGSSVHTRFQNHPVDIDGETIIHHFSPHSAGPFGDDVPGPWMTQDNFFMLLAYARLGWKDIHATLVCQPDPAHSPSPSVQIVINF